MKIALYCSGGVNLDFSTPQKGNPGGGGLQQAYLMLAWSLANFSDVTINFYHRGINKLPCGVNSYLVHDYKELFDLVKLHENDIFIFPVLGEHEIIDALKSASQDIIYIAWVHNYVNHSLIKYIYEIHSVKRIVFVSHELYDHYIDSEALTKCTFIFNMFDGRYFTARNTDSLSKHIVTYTAGLYKNKTFHVLASMWKDILHEVPDAKLYVIGSGKLYNKDSKLGPLGLADEEYEAVFTEALMSDGKLLPSVKFLGLMGQEKSEIYNITSVGITNFNRETFCYTALEMEACAIPVVNKATGGFLDTVKHGVTGLQGKNYDEIKRYIIMLLKDKELNLRLGRQAHEFASSAFLPEKIIKQWLKLFDDVMNGKPAEYLKPSGNFREHYKWLKIINRWLRLHHLSPASLHEIWYMVHKFINGVKNIFQ